MRLARFKFQTFRIREFTEFNSAFKASSKSLSSNFQANSVFDFLPPQKLKLALGVRFPNFRFMNSDRC